MKKWQILSSFWLKIIAIVTMTFDHVGLFLSYAYYSNTVILQIASIFRAIGRLAFPLFVFMIVEGVIHTKNIKKYFFRLGIFALILSIVFIVAEYSSLNKYSDVSGFLRSGNIFMELLLIAIGVYALKEKGWKKLLILLPIVISSLSFIVKGLERTRPIDIHWFPAFLTFNYDWVGVLLGIGFYYSYTLADTYINVTSSTTKMDKDIWVMNGNYRLLVNIIAAFVNLVVYVFYYSFIYIWPNAAFISNKDAMVQLLAIISGAFILLYNGKRGYNSKWFQFGAYIYYPLHVLILIVIYIIMNGGL